MKLKYDFVIQQVDTQFAAVAVGVEARDFCAMLKLNAMGAFLMKQLASDITLEQLYAAAEAEAAGIDSVRVDSDVDDFLQKLRCANLLIE